MSMRKCKECKKEISSNAEACPHCGAKAKKKHGCLAYLAAGMFLLFAIWQFFGSWKDRESPIPTQSVPTFGTLAPETLKALPWLTEVQANCEGYKAAPNDIKRSEVFRTNEAALRRVRIKDAQGTLRTLSTSQGGDELRLVVGAGNVKFATESLFGAIKRGSGVYKQASALREGSCVVFSAGAIQASSLTERSKVCDLDYFAKFTSVRPCDG